jgi:poly(A) polymerase
VAFTEAWEEDAQRRDFRMNALYAGADGEIFDPAGGGLDDIRAGLIKFIGDPVERIREDYLRILRFFRFNAWYGQGAPDADGLAACLNEKNGLKQLSVERIWKEIKKLLAAANSLSALSAMHATGIFAATLPEADRFDRLHKLVDLEAQLALPGDSMTRMAAALMDQESARALARRLKLSNEERARLVAALGDDERITSFMSMRELRRALYRIGAEAFIDRAMLAWAEAGGDKAQQWRALIELAKTWTRPNFPLSGEEVMAAGVSAGPKIGAVLREVEIWWIDSDFTDDKLSIVERLKAVAQGIA